ncbi:hypothetical protein B0H13DRAFT_1936192 [Mycena leptocephala]|nr:hypothetical protein B0H13DRAFT_1936192 [Mycena leptocephala]
MLPPKAQESLIELIAQLAYSDSSSSSDGEVLEDIDVDPVDNNTILAHLEPLLDFRAFSLLMPDKWHAQLWKATFTTNPDWWLLLFYMQMTPTLTLLWSSDRQVAVVKMQKFRDSCSRGAIQEKKQDSKRKYSAHWECLRMAATARDTQMLGKSNLFGMVLNYLPFAIDIQMASRFKLTMGHRKSMNELEATVKLDIKIQMWYGLNREKEKFQEFEKADKKMTRKEWFKKACILILSEPALIVRT